MITLDRTQAPPFRLSSDYSLTHPETYKLSNGVELFAFRGLEQEVVKLELIFEAGKWYEPKLGVSHFTSQMLSKGTENLTSFQIAEAIDSLGAHLEINQGYDVVTISLFSLRKNIIAALVIVMDLLKNPSFDDEELRLMKEIFMQGLRVNNEKTSVVASKKIRRAIFGKDHPYGSSVEEADVKKIERKDLRTFFHDRFSLHSAFLIGRLTDDEISEVIGAIPAPLLKHNTRSKFERTPGILSDAQEPASVQASIRLGKKCLSKSEDKEYFDAVMFSHILGGFFGSRLMKNIREEKGLTYGIYSSMQHFLRDSFWVIGAEVNQQNASRAIEEIQKEIRVLQDEPVSEQELEIAKNYFIGSWQSENSTLFAVADKIKNIHLYGLSENYYINMLTHIQKITPAQIQQAGRASFDAGGLIEVQVG
ncbi:pitrilysin family protein [soil metagenome]